MEIVICPTKLNISHLTVPGQAVNSCFKFLDTCIDNENEMNPKILVPMHSCDGVECEVIKRASFKYMKMNSPKHIV